MTTKNELSAEEWMNTWMNVPKAPGGIIAVSRFKEPIYFLLQPISWKPNPDQVGMFEAVHVPIGFVTDLASIPPIFFSLLRPDGEYTHPAIIHDFLYWTQTRPREVADQILKLGMQEFEIGSGKVNSIYLAVRAAGGSAWRNNEKLKAQGEKRILKKIPDDPRTSWLEWKKRPDVFAT